MADQDHRADRDVVDNRSPPVVFLERAKADGYRAATRRNLSSNPRVAQWPVCARHRPHTAALT
jgi:hypothetical protein